MHTEIPAQVRRYRLKPATHLRNALITVMFWCVLGVPLIPLWFEAVTFLQAKDADAFIRFMGPALLVVVVLMSFTFLVINLVAVLELFSYIRVAPDGIEQRRSPFRHVKCGWAELEKLDKLFPSSDIILVNSPAGTSKPVAITPIARLLLPKKPYILLSSFEGWPDGALKHDLQKYAPQLFQVVAEEESA